MGNVIQWADYVKALETIAEEQLAVSGMTVAEAAAARGFTKAASGMYLKTVMSTAAQSAIGATATEVVATGAAGAATTTAVNLTLVEGAGGTATVAGIGSIALPIAACIAAAGGGYLIGKELNKNPAYSSFFDNLVFKTADFVTGNNYADELLAPATPLLYDANGNTYLSSGLVTGVINYLDGVPAASAQLDAWLSAHNITYPMTVNNYPLKTVTQYGDTLFFISGSNTPLHVQFSATHGDAMWFTDGVTYLFNQSNGSFVSPRVNNGYASGWNYAYTQNVESISPAIPFCNYDVYYNAQLVKTPTVNTPSEMPDVITQYTPALPVNTPITDPNGDTWTQVYLPSTNPLEMPDGEPVPEVATPYPERLTPYIPPFQPQPAEVPVVIPDIVPANPIVIPNPEPDTSTAPYPQSNPALDPSQLAEPVSQFEPIEPLPNPINTGSPSLPILPSAPSPSSAKGLLHVYNPTPAQVDLFGEWLWTTFSGDIIDTISKLFNNPMDAVIGLHELYCNPVVSAVEVNIRAGYLDSNVPSRLVASRYKEIKCGAISVPEYWGNYLDYSPYTKSYCYLPFIGIVELNTDDIVGSGVEITYRIDTYNGSCIALITTAKPNSAESVTYQFEGNCSVSVPITSGMMTAVQNALIGVATTALSAAATAAVTVATGGTALPAAVMLGSVAAGATKQGVTSKNQVQYSGSFGSSFGAMGIKIPFLIIKRPRQKVVYGYNINYGYPAHKMVLISTCSGYLKAKEVDVISSTATEAEKKMIEQLLKSGVFVD